MPQQQACVQRAAAQASPLDPDRIVAWAQEHFTRTGAWPGPTTPGIIPGTCGEKWKNLDMALRLGSRALPGGSSLMRLLAERCGVRNRNAPPPLALDQILTWADAHHERSGRWPKATDGPIPEAPGESWAAVDHALTSGTRGLPGRSSLPRLLANERGHRNMSDLSPVTAAQVVAWAEEHFRRTRKWPNKRTRTPIPDAPGETWTNLDASLRVGTRGLPGGSSLARLLAEARGTRNRAALPPLCPEQILDWADAFWRQHGRWPREPDGRIPRSGGETWSGVDQALCTGLRGLPGGSSLPRLLAEKRGYRYRRNRPPLSYGRILRWADTHHDRTGRWPTPYSGPVRGEPGENWGAIDAQLRRGGRGLPGGSSLICLLAEARGAEHLQHPRQLSVPEVLALADAFHRQTGRWPDVGSGPVAPGTRVSWRVVHDCLRRGRRGLPGGTTLSRFLTEHGWGEPMPGRAGWEDGKA